jgi:hypothetical protein
VLEDKPNRDMIDRAEDLILRLREVQSCRIYADEQGIISEIHVVAATDRAPKLIARDVEGCLKAMLGITIDYRKIGVVVIEPGKEASPRERAEEAAPHSPGPAADPVIDLENAIDARLEEMPGSVVTSREDGARLEFLENDVRVKFKGLRVSIEEDRVDVEVRLAKGALEVTGSQGDFRFRGKLYETIAGAAIHAISELLDENIHLCLSGVEEVSLDGRMALCAVVRAIDGRSVASYVGCALIGEERNESAVLAILDALNRPLGAWKLRTSIHYTIR